MKTPTPTLRGGAAAILIATLAARGATAAEPATAEAARPATAHRPAKAARPATASHQPAKAAAAAAPGPATRLLVTIVVDQLAAWIAAERWPELPPDGGFARLRREGLYVRELRYDHAVTDTAPGHSALYTGAVPRDSGIIGNDLIHESNGAVVSILADPRSRLLVAGGGGAAAAKSLPGVSLAALAVDTLADVLARRDGQARIYSFSLKDRGALFGAGRHPTVALWLDPDQESFVSSTAFATAIPDWVTPLGGRDAVRAASASVWKPLDADWVAAHALTPDPQPGEGDYAGLGQTFPHPVRSAKAMRATPAGDQLLLGLARGAISRAAPAPHATLLALSFSSNDYVGHMFGPDSWEAWDELRQLDRRLAELLAALDDAVGKDSYAVMLSGDHGIGALPELEGSARRAACRRTSAGLVGANPAATGAGAGADADANGGAGASSSAASGECTRGRRLLASDVTTSLERAWQRELGVGAGEPNQPKLIAGMTDALVYLTARARSLVAATASAPATRARLARAGTAALRDPFGVAEVVDIRDATAACAPPADQSRAALVCRALRPAGAADFYLVVEPRVFFDAHYTPGAGANHGSPYLYDRTVPLLVRAPGRVAAGQVRDQPVSFTAFVRTAASLLGLPAPAGAGAGEDLTTTRPAR